MIIGSKAWREGLLGKTKNIASVLRSAGLLHLSFPAMQLQLKFLKDDGIADSEENLTWMRCLETVPMEVLSLTPAIDRRPRRRQKIDVNNWLLLREQLRQIDP